MDAKGRVDGTRNEHEVQFFGISTCVWCKRTRQFLEDHDVTFEYTYVDLLEGDEREMVRNEVRVWNPRVSFPTLVIDNDFCVIGYRPKEIAGALDL